MSWYYFNQNTSGGSFISNDKLCSRLFIEAPSEKAAESIAEGLGVYFDGVDNGIDCPCCGDRWYRRPEKVKLPLRLSNSVLHCIEDYAQFLADEYGWTTPDARIYYADGRVVEIFKRAKEWGDQ